MMRLAAPIRAVGLVLALLAAPLLASSSVQAASTAAERAAMKKFDRAQRAFDAKRFKEALALFRDVAKVLESPNSLYMAGRCLRRLKRFGEAFEAMSATVELATRRSADDEGYLETRDEAAAQREALAAKIGRVVVVPAEQLEGIDVRVGERAIDRRQWGKQLAVEPGVVRGDRSRQQIVATQPQRAPRRFERVLLDFARFRRWVRTVFRSRAAPDFIDQLR